jgi:hypothetical protein
MRRVRDPVSANPEINVLTAIAGAGKEAARPQLPHVIFLRSGLGFACFSDALVYKPQRKASHLGMEAAGSW